MNLIPAKSNKGKPNRVVDILMRRDGLNRKEAEIKLEECQKLIQDAFKNGNDVEDIIAMVLGLESDYIFDILC